MAAEVYSPKERLLRVLKKQETERPPTICPGGMMNTAITEIMRDTGHTLPEAHHGSELMGQLAWDVMNKTGFENFGIPFCMTIEAEALGSEIDFGTISTEPSIKREPFASVDAVEFLPPGAVLKTSRAGALMQAAQGLKNSYPDIPVIGSITGPVSLGSSLVDPMTFLKELRKKPEASHRFLNYATEQLISYAKELADNGAGIICIADPTATGEILGPKLFGEFVVPYINRIVDAVHTMNVPVIIHICGDVNVVKKELPSFKGDAISVDAMVSLKKIQDEYPELTTMGNLNTYMLQSGNVDMIRRGALQLLQHKIAIPAPACGLSTSTPLAHIRAFTETVKKG